jgi:hypothetical protein
LGAKTGSTVAPASEASVRGDDEIAVKIPLFSCVFSPDSVKCDSAGVGRVRRRFGSGNPNFLLESAKQREAETAPQTRRGEK